jgi:hypothetical protein
LLIGVLGLKTDGREIQHDYGPKADADELGTENELEKDESYAHITLLQPISQSASKDLTSWPKANLRTRILMPDLRRLSEVIKPNKTDQGDGWAFFFYRQLS